MVVCLCRRSPAPRDCFHDAALALFETCLAGREAMMGAVNHERSSPQLYFSFIHLCGIGHGCRVTDWLCSLEHPTTYALTYALTYVTAGHLGMTLV